MGIYTYCTGIISCIVHVLHLAGGAGVVSPAQVGQGRAVVPGLGRALLEAGGPVHALPVGEGGQVRVPGEDNNSQRIKTTRINNQR